jgi:hypothetical protein
MLPEGCGALEAVLCMDTPQSRAAAAYEAALEAVEAGAPGAQAELSRCTTEMDAAGDKQTALLAFSKRNLAVQLRVCRSYHSRR